MIFVESKKKSKTTLARLYPCAEVIDVTSKGQEPFIRLSPFYPHGDIPVPFSTNTFADSVEGIWQGLKVFEKSDIDISKFDVQNMKGLKRTVRKYGKTLGHRKGTNGAELIDYVAARRQIYLPCYAWILQNKATQEVEQLVSLALKADLVLLDFETNTDIENTRKPLSHAALIKKFIDKKHPELASRRFSQLSPSSTLELKRKNRKTDSKERHKGKKETNPVNEQLTIDF